MKVQSIMMTSLLVCAAVTACAEMNYGSSVDTLYDSPTITLAKTDMIIKKVSTSVGEVFATSKGLTLYIFTKDTPGKSNCDGGCADNWPPFAAKKNANTWGEFTVIERADASYQWAYKNQPLYTWVGDQKEGDINGHGIGNVWYAAETK